MELEKLHPSPWTGGLTCKGHISRKIRDAPWPVFIGTARHWFWKPPGSLGSIYSTIYMKLCRSTISIELLYSTLYNSWTKFDLSCVCVCVIGYLNQEINEAQKETLIFPPLNADDSNLQGQKMPKPFYTFDKRCSPYLGILRRQIVSTKYWFWPSEVGMVKAVIIEHIYIYKM